LKARRRAPSIIIATAAFLLLILFGVGHLLTTQLLKRSKDTSFELMRGVLASTLRSNEEKAVVRAEILASMPAVRAAFIARDRPKLAAECQRAYTVLDQKYGASTAQFHTPPGVSFLRLHEPDKFGDDQTSYRPILSDVNANAAIRRGITVSRSGPAIYGIVPIADDAGKHVGSFEMSIELAPVLDRLKDNYHIEAAAFIDEKLLHDVATNLGGDVMTPKNRVGRFIRFHATHPKLVTALVTDREVEVRDPTTYERTFEGTLWGVQLVPMYDYAGKQIGVFAVAESLADIKSRANRARIWQALAAIFAIVLVSGIVLIVVRGLVLSPVEALGQRLTALANGDASQPADELESYPDELKPLAEGYEKLRAQRTS
jgi:methyl-accepting chemotaxis protein